MGGLCVLPIGCAEGVREAHMYWMDGVSWRFDLLGPGEFWLVRQLGGHFGGWLHVAIPGF